jgi:hypothetical protein
MIYVQLVKFCCGVVWFIHIGPRLDEFFFKLIIDGVSWKCGCRNGYNLVLHTLLPFVGVRFSQVGEGVHNFALRVLQNGVKFIHKLIQLKFMEKFISL